jgi:hypothetical protein
MILLEKERDRVGQKLEEFLSWIRRIKTFAIVPGLNYDED